MNTVFKKATACLVSAAMLIAAAPAVLSDMYVCAKTRIVSQNDDATATQVKVLVKAEDYTAVASEIDGASKTGLIAETEVPAASAADAIEKALTAAGVDYDMSMGYVSEVNGLSQADGYAMSGWMLAYNNDDCDNWGLDYIHVKDGDTLSLIYTLDGGADIASASSGLPTLKTLEIAGLEYEFQTITAYDADWNPSYTYKVNGKEMEGAGTKDNPFVIECDIAPEYKDGKVTYSYTTYANQNYVSVDAAPYISAGKDNEITVTSRGGRKAYYNINVSFAEQPTGTPKPTDTPKPTNTPKPTETPKATDTPEPTETPKATDTPEPTETPKATDTPEPTKTPQSTVTPLPAATEPAYTNQPVHTAKPLPSQTAVQPKAPGKAKVKSLKLSGNKLKVFVKKVKGAKGYKITAASDKAFKKNRKIKYTSKAGITFSKCTKNRYYVKVRAYVIGADGRKIYGRESRTVRIVLK
ncbi:MAG: DUF4430 domain-containing protein [Lachnospiraceae bacterium]|nr:DUF4430 domain-containing protein [Lachnospiraceae bacterium]